ncbi:MAG: Bug family tripartite tricarboxylate transporter substrate binding protein [Bacillota bacterium]
MKLKGRLLALIGVLSLVIAALAGCGGQDQGKSAGKQSYPSKPVEFVVHTNPGDGVDLFIRTAADIINKEKLFPQPVNVINKVGGSGAVAMGYVSGKEGENHTLITSQPSTLTTPLRNNLGIGYKDFTHIARVIAEESVVAVRADSPYKTMSDLIAEAKKKPKGVSHGTGVLGAADTVLDFLIAKATGVQFNVVSFKGGGENIVALLGGNVDFVTVNPSEVIGQVEAGKVRLIGIASDKRLPKLPDVPTLKEQGIDVVFQSFRGVSGPKGMSPEAVKFWEDAFKKVAATEAWKKYLNDNMISDVYLAGQEYGKYMEEQDKMYSSVLKEMGVLK